MEIPRTKQVSPGDFYNMTIAGGYYLSARIGLLRKSS